MNVAEAIAFLVKQVPNPSMGLPDDVFYYVSRTTPLVNVDLLIKDEEGRTLLSWRNDRYAGKGWHVPGGIVRFKETLETRIRQVAASEIGVPILFEPVPIALHQIIHQDTDIRGHFISLLYKCFLSGNFVPQNKGLSIEDPGYLMWHDHCPDHLLKCQDMYRKQI